MGRRIQINEKAETDIPGLYAVGDEIGNFCAFIGGTVTFGWIAGKSAAEQAKGIPFFNSSEKHLLIEQQRQYFSEIMDRENGLGWKEANLTVQQIMNDYVVKELRSRSLLNAGMKYLRD